LSLFARGTASYCEYPYEEYVVRSMLYRHVADTAGFPFCGEKMDYETYIRRTGDHRMQRADRM
jgi:hypothetical protein